MTHLNKGKRFQPEVLTPKEVMRLDHVAPTKVIEAVSKRKWRKK